MSCLARDGKFCESFSLDELTHLRQQFSRRISSRKGGHLYHEGTRITELYCLVSGWVLLYHELRDGRRQGLDLLLPGAFFGFPLEPDTLATHSAVCITDCEVSCYSQSGVIELMREEPEIAIRALRLCSAERIRLHDLIVNVGSRSAPDRVIRFLHQLCIRLQSQTESEQRDWLPISQRDLSDLLGITAVHMSRVLADLKASGVISTKRGQLKILDAEQLAILSQAEHGREYALLKGNG